MWPGDREGDGVSSRLTIGVGRVLLRRCLTVAEVPLPHGYIALGLIEELHSKRGVSLCCIRPEFGF